MLRSFALLLLLATPSAAESLIATRVIRAQTLLSANDVTLVAAEIPGALMDPSEALGLEARVTLYPGRAIRASDIGPPALVERNQIVTLVYNAGGLGITTEGRALARGGRRRCDPGDEPVVAQRFLRGKWPKMALCMLASTP